MALPNDYSSDFFKEIDFAGIEALYGTVRDEYDNARDCKNEAQRYKWYCLNEHRFHNEVTVLPQVHVLRLKARKMDLW